MRVCIIIIIIVTDTQWKMIEEKENYIRNSASFLIEGACKTQRRKRPIYYSYEIGGMNGLITRKIKTDV